MMDIIKQAEKVARSAHKGQTRWNGEPYIVHPERVAWKLKDQDSKVVGWLHDVIEDTKFTPRDLANNGIPEQLINSIITLTRNKGETYYSFIMRIRKDPLATKVKIADIYDNLSDNMKEGSLKDKYRLALHILESQK